MIAAVRRWLKPHRYRTVIGPAAICNRLGHVEERTDLYGQGAKVTVIGCLRCDAVLSADALAGQYPLPKGA